MSASWRSAYEQKLADFARETARTSAMLAAVREVPDFLTGDARSGFLVAQAMVRAAANSGEPQTEAPTCNGFLDCPAAEHHPMCNAARAARADSKDQARDPFERASQATAEPDGGQ